MTLLLPTRAATSNSPRYPGPCASFVHGSSTVHRSVPHRGCEMPQSYLSKCAGLFLIVALGVFSPAVADAQATQATICKDGTSSASSGRGACSGHGGVDKAATKAARAPAKAATGQVTCTDGTTSKAGRGACSHHGGVMGVPAATSPSATPAPAPSTPRTRVQPTSPTLPAQVPEQSPARTRSEAKSQAPSARGSGKAEDNDPREAIAQCRDGLYSHAKHRRGACSRHGGVSKWMST